MNIAGVPADEQVDIAEAVERRLSASLRSEDGGFYADYVRLRFKMRKPDG
jgi:hypothetical protein